MQELSWQQLKEVSASLIGYGVHWVRADKKRLLHGHIRLSRWDDPLKLIGIQSENETWLLKLNPAGEYPLTELTIDASFVAGKIFEHMGTIIIPYGIGYIYLTPSEAVEEMAFSQ